MSEMYELWDVEAGNVVGEFTTRLESLVVVQTLLDRYGPQYAADLTLSRHDDGAPTRVIATGNELIEMLSHTQLPRNHRYRPDSGRAPSIRR